MKKPEKNKRIKIILAVILAVILCQIAIIITLFVLLQSPTRRLKEQLELAEKYLLNLDYEQAIAAYQTVIEIDPNCEEAYLAMADIYVELGDYAAAMEVLEEAEGAIGSKTIQDRIAEVQHLIEQDELERTEVVESQEDISQEIGTDVSIEKEDHITIGLDYCYDLTRENYLSNGKSNGYMYIYSYDEDMLYTYYLDELTLPWIDYIGFSWQDEYFVNNQEEAIDLYMQSRDFKYMDISEHFPNYIEFTIESIPFSVEIDTAEIGIDIHSVCNVTDGSYFSCYGIDDEGAHYAAGYRILLGGTVSCDDSYKNIFERTED